MKLRFLKSIVPFAIPALLGACASSPGRGHERGSAATNAAGPTRASSAATSPSTPGVAAASPPRERAPDDIDVFYSKRPGKLVVDGKLDEWAADNRTPGVRSRGEIAVARAAADEAGKAASWVEPKDQPAKSWVTVSMGDKDWVIAGDVSQEVGPEVAIGVRLARLDPCARREGGSGTYCDKSTEADFAAWAAEDVSFERYLLLASNPPAQKGMLVSANRTADPERQPTAIAVQQDGARMRFEVQLPLAALPFMAEGALTSVELGAVSQKHLHPRSNELPVSEQGAVHQRGEGWAHPWSIMPETAWRRHALPAPIRFDARAILISALHGDKQQQDLQVGYWPSEPRALFVWEKSSPASPRVVEMAKSLGKVGEAEVFLVGGTTLAATYGGELVTGALSVVGQVGKPELIDSRLHVPMVFIDPDADLAHVNFSVWAFDEKGEGARVEIENPGDVPEKVSIFTCLPVGAGYVQGAIVQSCTTGGTHPDTPGPRRTFRSVYNKYVKQYVLQGGLSAIPADYLTGKTRIP